MRTQHSFFAPVLGVCILVAGTACTVGPTDQAPVTSPGTTVGPNPALPAPEKKAIPVVQVAEAKGWPQGAAPTNSPTEQDLDPPQ